MDIVFINSLYLVLPLIIILIILNIIYYIYKKLINKSIKIISIIKTLLIPLFLLVFTLPSIYLVGGLFFDIKSKIKKMAIERSMEHNEHIIIMADDLILQFANNLENAHDVYKNKVIQVTGTIKYIGVPKDNPPLKDNSYILLSDLHGNEIGCYFTNNEQVPKLKNKKEHNIITIIGIYRESEISKNVRIDLGDCEIVNK
jgi:predicted membrane protein